MIAPFIRYLRRVPMSTGPYWAPPGAGRLCGSRTPGWCARRP